MLLGTPLLRMHFALGAQHFIGDLLSRRACTFVAEMGSCLRRSDAGTLGITTGLQCLLQSNLFASYLRVIPAKAGTGIHVQRVQKGLEAGITRCVMFAKVRIQIMKGCLGRCVTEIFVVAV